MMTSYSRSRVILWIFVALVSTGLMASSCHVLADRERAHKKTTLKLQKFIQNAAKETDRSVRELDAQHQNETDQGILYKKILRGNPAIKQVAITFDDGPHPAYTPRILEILDRYHVKATFFLVGKMAKRYPNLVQSEVSEGHVVGNHTYDHYNLTKIPQDDIQSEIHRCGVTLKKIIGKPVGYFRPPGGDYDAEVAQIANHLGYTMVLWTDDPKDYQSPGAKVIETRLLDHIDNGGIILIHDGIQQTIDILPQLLEYLKKNGYQLVTIDEMVKSSRSDVSNQKYHQNDQRISSHAVSRWTVLNSRISTHKFNILNRDSH